MFKTKDDLIKYIKGLDLDDNTKSVILEEVDKQELTAELMERIADLLEIKAEQARVESVVHQKKSESMEKLAGAVEDDIDQLGEEMDKVLNKAGEDMSMLAEKVKTAGKAQMDKEQMGQVRDNLAQATPVQTVSAVPEPVPQVAPMSVTESSMPPKPAPVPTL